MNTNNNIKPVKKLWSNAIKDALLADNGKKLTEMIEAMAKLLEGKDMSSSDRAIVKRLHEKLRRMQLTLGANLQK